MHILFDLRWLADEITVGRGIGRIALATLEELAKAPDIKISFLGLPNLGSSTLDYIMNSVEYLEFYIQPDMPHADAMVYAMRFNHWLKMIFEADNIDLLFDPAPTVTIGLKPHYYDVPYVVVFYDIIPALFNYPQFGDRWHGVQHLIANAGGIITISDTAYHHFSERYHHRVPCQNVVKALPSLGLPVATDYERVRKPYILSVTGGMEHKDPIAVLRALAGCSEHIRQHYSVKVLGLMDAISRTEFERLAVLHGIEVEILGIVDDAKLIELYREAAMLFHGSQYEGLGLPPIEAALLGTPIITSNGGALAELTTSKYFIFEASNYEQAAACIMRLDNCIMLLEILDYIQSVATELDIEGYVPDAPSLAKVLEQNQRAVLSMFTDDYLALVKPVLERAADG